MRDRVAAIFAFAVLGYAGAARAAPLEAYGRLPTLELVKISPDGQRIAYVKGIDAQRYVVIQDLAKREPPSAIRVSNQKIRDLTWADNDHLLITASQTATIPFLLGPRQEWSLTMCFDVPKKEQWGLMQGPKDVEAMNVTVGLPEPRIVDGRTIVFLEGLYFPENTSVLGLFSVDLESRRIRLVEGKSGTTRGWVVNAQGNAVAEVGYRQAWRHWSLLAKRDGTWSEIYGLDAAIDEPYVVGLTANDGALFVQVPTDHGYVLKIVSLTDGSVTDPSSDIAPADGFFVDPANDRVLGGWKNRIKTSYTFLDPNDRQWNSIVDAYADEHVKFASWSQDHRKIVVEIAGPRDGDGFELVDLNTNQSAIIGPAYDGLGSSDIAPVTPFGYKAADGFTIPAYLTLPRDRAPKNLALIVLPHGGPADRDQPGFDWLAQSIASRGYAVLQPEFRGSTGFGWDHLAAGFGQWGRKMQTDLSDGVRALAAKGIIDPKRVCIFGASYGGYAALAGATLDRGVYRCAVSVGGLSDLPGFLSWIRGREGRSDTETMRYWTRFMGASDRDDPVLDRISPIKSADKADIPILLIHGRDDTVVPIAQSQDMADALKAAGKPFTLVALESEDHWLSRSETRLQMLKATVDFLETNNPP